MTLSPFNDINAPNWDTLILGNIVFPGIVQNAQPQVRFDWEEPKSSGTKGGRVQYKGAQLKAFNFTILIYNDEQWEEWENLLTGQLKEQMSGEKGTPLEIIHPVANNIGVSFVVIQSIDMAQPSNDGGYLYALQLLEYTETVATEKKASQKASTAPKPERDVGKPVEVDFGDLI